MANSLKVDLIADPGRSFDTVDKFERRIVGTETELTRLGKSGNAAGRELATGLGIPLGPTAALLAGVGLLTVGVNKAMDAARLGADANRVLSASAIEAGFSYDLATEKAQKFADQTGLTGTQSKQTFASIIQVAKVAGQTEDLDNIQRRFADLAAARGVAAQDLSTLAQQILSGQDEALNRLGLADPSKLAAEWAAAHGTTVEAMSQTEQVASRLDAVMRKGAMFDGSAEARLASVSGQMTLTEQSMGNLATGVGEAIFANLEFRDLLGEINRALGSIAISSDDVRRKLRQGLSPEMIAKGLVDENSTWDNIKGAMTAPFAGLNVGLAAAQDNLFGNTGQYEAAITAQNMALDPAQRRLAVLKDQIENQKLLMALEDKGAADQKRINEEKREADAERIAAQQAFNLTFKTIQTEIGRDENLNTQIAGIKRLRVETEAYGKTGEKAFTESKEKLASLDEQLFKTQKQIEGIIQSTFKDTRTFLDDMLERVNKDNPFVKLFSEADTVMERSRERFRSYGEAFVQQMAAIENKAIEMERISLRIQSSQKVLDLQGEIRKLQFGPTGPSAEDQRRLSIYGAQISAARDIPGLEAQARAVEQAGYGRAPGVINQNALVRKQIEDLLRLRSQFSGETDYGDREARSRINQELISRFESATPQMQAQLIQRGGRGFREEIAGAYRGQAADRQQQIEDEIRRAQASRFDVELAQKKLVDLQRFGGFDNDEMRKQYLAVTGSLGEAELTPELRRGRTSALQEEAKKEAAKEEKAEKDRVKLNEVLDLIKGQLTGKGFKVDQAGAGVLVEVIDKSDRATAKVLGEGFK